MSTKQFVARLLLLWIIAYVAILWSIPARADVVRVTNANNHEIPIKVGTEAEIDDQGNVLVECALNASGACAELFGGTAVIGAPTVTLSRTDNNTTVTDGESIKLGWGSTLATTCTATQTGPYTTSWPGPKARRNGAGETIILDNVGTFVFSIQCENAAGSSDVSSQTVTVSAEGGGGEPGGGPGDEDCDLEDIEGDPLYQPAGWTLTDMTFAEAFTPQDGDPVPAYPNSLGFPVPVGADRGGITVISFTANATQTVNMIWDRAQANPGQGYGTARPASGMFFSVSPCRGDVRAPDAEAGGFLAAGCRKFSNEGVLIWSTSPSLSASTSAACKVTAGRVYFLHVMAADPSDGLDEGEESCDEVPSTAEGCDVQARASGI